MAALVMRFIVNIASQSLLVSNRVLILLIALICIFRTLFRVIHAYVSLMYLPLMRLSD